MDWKAVGPIIGAVAPLAGSILGGLIPFPGGSLIGQKFGEIIARQFGVEPTPEKVRAAVSDTVVTAGEETARAKINAAMEQARAEIAGFVEIERVHTEALAKVALGTQETMRAEDANRVQLALAGKQEHWFFTGWRPAIGWVFGTVALAFGLMLVWSTGLTAYRAPDPLKALNDAWPLFFAYFGVLGLVVGVMIPSRSAEKKAAIENAAPMPNAKPVAPSIPLQKIAPRAPAMKGDIIPDPPGSR